LQSRFEDPRAALRRHGLWAKHSWGQNFLVDPSVHERIVRESGAEAGRTVLEIGAGLGTLTAGLLASGAHVIAIERDRDMVAVLRDDLGADSHLRILEANAATVDYAAVAPPGARVVGNLPYQIASQILLKVLEARDQLARVVVMLQLEVAERLVAEPGSSEYGGLGVIIARHAQARLAFRVAPAAFHPRPKVHSAVVVLEPVRGGRFDVTSEQSFRDVVHAAFGQRRKTLWNALRGAPVFAGREDVLRQALGALGIDPARRGETLSPAELAALEVAIANADPKKGSHA
jgi:16S rRNA (adenine1518-N6/adenine1519-N6)-dimethyltransferase